MTKTYNRLRKPNSGGLFMAFLKQNSPIIVDNLKYKFVVAIAVHGGTQGAVNNNVLVVQPGCMFNKAG